uniref:Uncharacterized protein n=1 Tax=Anguilla anguilla TaxID=7936 RepID=A0A0E9UUL7_ANGAN
MSRFGHFRVYSSSSNPSICFPTSAARLKTHAALTPTVTIAFKTMLFPIFTQ